MALNFYKLTRNKKCADKSIGSGILALLRFIYLALATIMNEDFKNTPYPKRVIAFVDILGYKELIEQKRFFDVYRVIERLKNELKPGAFFRDDDWQFTTFSDCFVVSYSLEKGDNYSLIQLLSLLENIKFSLGCKGISLRGGISYGEFWHRNGDCLGPAMIDAYILESKKAKYPRIILDPKIVTKFDVINNENALHILDKHMDDYYFISSLARKSKYDPTNHQNIKTAVCGYLEMEKKNIEKGLKEIPEKYEWLKTYYNKKCNEKIESMPELSSEIRKLVIGT